MKTKGFELGRGEGRSHFWTLLPLAPMMQCTEIEKVVVLVRLMGIVTIHNQYKISTI